MGLGSGSGLGSRHLGLSPSLRGLGFGFGLGTGSGPGLALNTDPNLTPTAEPLDPKQLLRGARTSRVASSVPMLHYPPAAQTAPIALAAEGRVAADLANRRGAQVRAPPMPAPTPLTPSP